MHQTDAVDRSRILLMDRDLAGAAHRCARLTLAGWQVLHVADEIEALRAVTKEQVDLALLHLPVDDMLDMDLPGVLRDVAPCAYLPVMVLADSAAERDRCYFLDSGADEVISAGTTAEEMVSRIGALLRIKDLNDQLSASRSALLDALDRERKLLARVRSENHYLQALATTDPLTRVQNLRSFQDILVHEFRIAKRYDQPLSLLTLDVDHFKVVNDTHGHPSGDYVLKELAVILKQSIRESDVAARTGGEEFSVILPRADRGQAARFAQRIRHEVRSRQFIVYGRNIHITASLGSATFPTDAQVNQPEMLVYFADQALLAAKETGRDRVVAFHHLNPAVRARLRRQFLGRQPATEESRHGPDQSAPVYAHRPD